MNLAKLLAFFETSPAVRLMRSPNAPFIVAFLDQQFKRAGRITIPYSELQAALATYLEGLQETYPAAPRDKPEAYLSAWCSADTRWLHRFLEIGRAEPVYQLTPHTEDVLVFLDRTLGRDFGFVGTESRLRLVIETLDDLVVGASDDPEMRLARLRADRQRIDQEIARIESDGSVTPYQPAQIRERFATAVSLLKQLQGDFRAVEDKFREITRQVQKRQAEGQDTRGGILGFALDAEDVLKREDQGVSFYEFVRFILSPSQQERLESIIRQLGRVHELADQADGLETVRRMVPLLLAEAEKVMRTNQRLSATLRRLLDVRARRDRERVGALGKGVTLLRYLPWLGPVPLAYWGDLDVQGFEILSSLRAIFPQTRSILMDETTLARWRGLCTPGNAPRALRLPHLTEAERAAYDRCRNECLRLEQERLPVEDVATAIARLEESLTSRAGVVHEGIPLPDPAQAGMGEQVDTHGAPTVPPS